MGAMGELESRTVMYTLTNFCIIFLGILRVHAEEVTANGETNLYPKKLLCYFLGYHTAYGASTSSLALWRLTMTRVSVPLLEWDALGEAMRVHEPPSGIGSQFFRLLEGAGYDPEEIRTVARSLYSHVDYEDTGDAP